jgi:hypothetical protein
VFFLRDAALHIVFPLFRKLGGRNQKRQTTNLNIYGPYTFNATQLIRILVIILKLLSPRTLKWRKETKFLFVTSPALSERFVYFKGAVPRDFRPSGFFHRSIPTRALIHGLTPFRIWLRIRRDNRF